MNPPRLSRRANHDLVEIAKYVSKDDPVAASPLLERLEDACQKLADTPSLGVPI